MKLFMFTVFTTVFLTQLYLVESIFLPWSSSTNESSDGFRIAKAMIDLNKKYDKFGSTPLQKLKNLTSQVSLDQRCFGENNMPMSIAFHKNAPYAFFLHANTGLHIRGMFPSLLSDILDYCCQGGAGKVKFAKFLRTPLEAEDRFLGNKVSEYDFTFPIHAPAGARSFRDHSFIPLVHVPSVVLLAYDGNERTSKTHAIATTILRAWPIMVFILLTATFSGIIIWFLVSPKIEFWRNKLLYFSIIFFFFLGGGGGRGVGEGQEGACWRLSNCQKYS